jgi:hypothetical protein
LQNYCRVVYTERVEKYSLATPPQTAAPVPAPPAGGNGTEIPVTPPSPLKKYKKFFIIGGIAAGILLLLLIVLLVSAGSGRKQNETAVPTGNPTITPVEIVPSPTFGALDSTIQYLPEKQYFDDSVAVITKTAPHHVLFISAARSELERNYAQYTKVNYFNGTQWIRENVTTAIPRSDIINNPLLKQWSLSTTVSTSTQDSNKVTVMIDDTNLTYTVRKISADISTKSYPGYTKFTYFGEGTLKTADDELDAYIMYTQTYAINAFDLSFLSTPEKLENDWMVFWDEQGNTYHADILSSEQKNKPFQNYASGVVVLPNGSAVKTNQASVRASGLDKQYTVQLGGAIPSQLSLTFTNPLNKATNKSYIWQTGIISGELKSTDSKIPPVKGIGLMEMIHKAK